MPRQGALITTWANPVPGREAKALEVFEDFVTFWAKKAADGHCSEPETLFNSDGATGMTIVRGTSDALREIVESDEFDRLLSKGMLVVNGVRVEFWYGGTEEAERLMRIYAEAAGELGYL